MTKKPHPIPPADAEAAKLHPYAKIRLIKEKPFYGPGAHQLLVLTEETGSLRHACSKMGLSYSKGRSIVALIEEQTGHPVIVSQQGGKTGGYSLVTDEARKLMQSYSEFAAEANQCLGDLFLKHFPQ